MTKKTHLQSKSNANLDFISNSNHQNLATSQPNSRNNSQSKSQNANIIKHKKPINKESKNENQQESKTINRKIEDMTHKVKKSLKELPETNKVPEESKISRKEKIELKGKQWSELQCSLRNEIVYSVKRCNFQRMLPVQEASIPLLLKNYDLAVEAQTGSGKTLSFLIPLLEKYLSLRINEKEDQENSCDEFQEFKPSIKFLVISPTRELCQQTFNVLSKLIENLPSKERSQKYLQYCHCATGGSDMTSDIQKLKNSTVVFVGTVGRIRELAEHMDQNWLKKVEYLFIDEADRVLKEKGIEQLIRSVQKIRRTAMLSATLQTLNEENFEFYGMRNLAKISLKQTLSTTENPTEQKTSLNEDKKYIIPKSLTNTYLKMPSRVEKMEFLVKFLKKHLQSSKSIVFFSTCASVDFYTKLFNHFFNSKHEDEEIVGLHGKLKTKRREKLINSFLKRSYGCLFATDVVSRGIDFDHIHFIVQVDPPEDPDNYVHRIGRTARINRPGTAILLIEQHEEAFINYLSEKSVGVQEIINPQCYYYESDCTETIKEIAAKMESIMRTDRDFVEKSKKAFVSYIRSYKEHDLRFIFEFKNLDIGKTANSFFMYRIPRIKEILGKSISSFTQSSFDIETIPWLNKNQEFHYKKKKEERMSEILFKKNIHSKINDNSKIKNNKTLRKRINAKMENRFLTNLNKEHKLLLKEKTESSRGLKIHHELSQNEQNESEDFNNSENTEEIEERIAKKIIKNELSSHVPLSVSKGQTVKLKHKLIYKREKKN